jgi:predicted ATPase
MLVLPLTSLTVVTGGNGTGKSSLYRALRLLADGARNGMVAALAREGGLPSVLWAGPEHTGRAVREGRHPVQGRVRSGSVALRLGFGAEDLSYAIDLGLPLPAMTAFGRDPVIKRESVWTARGSQVGTRTPVLSHDGADLAAALQTIKEVGDAAELDSAVAAAFPGSSLTIAQSDDGRLSVQLSQHGLLRPLGAPELSDGTLRYCCGSPPCSVRARPGCSCSTSQRTACTRTCCPRSAS